VLPAVLALEWFARVARTMRPDLVLAAIRDLHVKRGLRLDGFAAGVVLRVGCRESGNGPGRLALELRGRDGVLHYTATAEMATPGTIPIAPTVVLGTHAEPATVRAEDLYRNVLFHGPGFHAIRTLEVLGAAGASAQVLGVADLGWPGGWCTDAAALDAGLQLAIAWGHHLRGRPWLPTRIEGFVPHASGPLPSPLRCVLTGRDVTDLRTLCDIAFVAAGGRVVAELHGVEMHALPASTETRDAVAAEPAAR
jgi:hypothetical protein